MIGSWNNSTLKPLKNIEIPRQLLGDLRSIDKCYFFVVVKIKTLMDNIQRKCKKKKKKESE